MSINDFAKWCDGGDILAPRWREFLRDTCVHLGEVAVPAERDSARLCGGTDVRIAILQTSGASAGEHAVTFIKQTRNQMRRYDNDSAARARGTFTVVTWEAIL